MGCGRGACCDEGAGLVVDPIPYDLFQITAPINRQRREPGDPCHTLAKDNASHAAVVLSAPPPREFNA